MIRGFLGRYRSTTLQRPDGSIIPLGQRAYAVEEGATVMQMFLHPYATVLGLPCRAHL